MGTTRAEPRTPAERVVFVGGPVRILDGVTPVQEALVADEGRIVGVGGRDEMLGLAGARARRVNLGGATLMPGLIDTHPHVLHFAARQCASLDLTDVRDHADIVDRIRDRAVKTPPGQWILTTPIGEPHYFIRRSYRDLPERRLPDRHVLDRATRDHPVMIQAWAPTTPNVCAFNSAGLAALGLNDLLPDRACNVWFDKDEQGRLTGVLRGDVNNYYSLDPFWIQLLTKLPGPETWELHDSTIAGMAEYNRQGVTTVYEGHNMSPAHIDVYRRLRQENALTLRVMAALEAESYAYPPFRPLSMDAFMARLELGRSLIAGDDHWLRITGLTFAHGNPCGPGLMRMHEPYRGPFGEPTRGVTFLSMEKQRAFVAFCAEHAVRANFCTAGFRDHDDFLAELEPIAERYRLPERRWLIQHAMLITEEQARRYARLGCVLTTSMSFSWGKGDLFGERIGPHIWRDQIPLKRLLNVGLTVGASSDWGPKNPWEHIQLAQTHEFAGSGYRNATPEHVVSREEALAMWTREAARALGWERIGTLAVGNRADLIVVDRDPLTCDLASLPGTEVLMTMVDGEVVFDRKGLPAA